MESWGYGDLVVTPEDNCLILQLTGFGKFQFFAESETNFFSGNRQLEFVRGDDDIVTHLVLQDRGIEITAPRKSNDG